MTMLQDFKKFLIRGNLVELAVAFIVGALFAALVKAFIADLITPIIALIVGQPHFGACTSRSTHSQFAYGDFLNALMTFVTTAAVVFFFVVKPYNTLMARRSKEEPDTKECPECTSAHPDQARAGAARSARRRAPWCRLDAGLRIYAAAGAVAWRRARSRARPRSRDRGGRG